MVLKKGLYGGGNFIFHSSSSNVLQIIKGVWYLTLSWRNAISYHLLNSVIFSIDSSIFYNCWQLTVWIDRPVPQRYLKIRNTFIVPPNWYNNLFYAIELSTYHMLVNHAWTMIFSELYYCTDSPFIANPKH